MLLNLRFSCVLGTKKYISCAKFLIRLYCVMISLEVRNMGIKAILRKSFARYGIIGIRNPSWRGCHEPTVPTALVKDFAIRSVSGKINKHK